MSDIELTVADVWATGISPTHYPTEFSRDRLHAMGVVPAGRLATVDHGTRVLVAGMVTHRQRPATASGIIFINLEDESGMINIICSTGLWSRYRRTARGSPALLVRGMLEREGGAILADRIAAIDLVSTPSRDFRCHRRHVAGSADATRRTRALPLSHRHRRQHCGPGTVTPDDRGYVTGRSRQSPHCRRSSSCRGCAAGMDRRMSVEVMSEVFERASVALMLADYAVADEMGKLQVVGGGLQIIGRDHGTGNSAAFALVVSLTFPPDVFNEQYAFEVVLEDESGTPVELGQAPRGATSNVMRFGQTLQVEEPNFRGSAVPTARVAGPVARGALLQHRSAAAVRSGAVLAQPDRR